MNANALVVILVLSAPVSAQTTLAWKFAKGQIIEAERVATQKQSVEVNGKTFKQTRTSTWHVRLEVKEQKGEAFVVHATLTNVTQKIEGAADGEIIDPKLHEKMQGSVFTSTVTPAGAIKELAGYEDFLKHLGGTDKTRLKALPVAFPETAVNEALADLFGPLPTKAVKLGDSWKRESIEPIPHFGALRCEARYTLDSEMKDRARIAYSIQTKYEIPKNEPTGLFRIVQGSIDSEKANGTITFDRAAGRVIQHERTMRLRGKLTIETMDRRQEIAFTSENQVRIAIK